MRKITLFLTLSLLMLFGLGLSAQVLLEENFDYTTGSLLTANGWTNHSGTTNFIDVTAGLTFNGYIGSAIGGAALLDNTGEDVNRTYTTQTTGAVYYAFLAKVNTVADGYFFNIGLNTIGTTFRGKVFMSTDGSNFKFGLSKGSNTATLTSSSYSIGETYLVVLKYEIVASTANDIVSLYIFPNGSFPLTEPGTPNVGPLTDATQSDIDPGSVALRQYFATQNVIVDGIRVATTWADAAKPYVPSTAADILTFSLAEQTGAATINNTNHTVAIEVASGTNVTALVPTITVSDKAVISPLSGVAQDFTNPVTYTVTAEDGTTTMDWTVTATVAIEPNHEAEIVSFMLAEEISTSIISSESAQVTSTVVWNTDKTALLPTITLSAGAQITPNTAQDFTNPVKYTVTAQDGTTVKEWTVTVLNAPEPNHAAEILTFELTKLAAPVTIDATAATIVGELVAGTNPTALTPTITVSEGAQVTPTVAQDFTNPVIYTVIAEDGTTTKDWTVTLTVKAIETVTIHNIQFTEDASGDSPLNGQVVKTSGYVTGVAAKGFYLQDAQGAWNGIYVYTNTTPTVMLGDMINITGLVKEYYNLTEIADATIEIVSSGNTLPESTIIPVGDFKEAYEGVLVTVKDAYCAVAPNNYGEWKLANETDTLVVDDEIFKYTAVLGDQFESVTGPGTYTFSVYKLLPRSNDDVVKAVSKATDILTFTLAEQHSAAVIDATNHTVKIAVNEGTNLTALTPTITVSSGATITPASGVAQDFSADVTYKVVAEDNVTEMDWVVTVTVYVGLSDLNTSKTTIYPNPVQNQLTISNLNNVNQVIISNVLGQDVFVLPVTERNITLNTASLRKGIYFITLVSANGTTHTERIVKE